MKFQQTIFMVGAFTASLASARSSYGDASSGDDNSYSNPSTFKAAMLDTHNLYRRQHQVSDLTWDSSAASAANSHARKCQFEHSGNSKYGENLSAGYGDATSSIKAWGDERSKYDFNNPSFSGETGHFTQMVWKSTSKVGCAAVKCNNIIGSGQQWFVVCNYSAPGNYIGEFPKNVLRQTNGGGKGSQSPSYGDNSDGEDRTPSKGNGGRSNYGNDTDTEDDSYDDGNNTDTEDEDDTPSYSHGKPSRKNQKNQPWYPYHGKNSGHRKQIDYKPYRPHRPRHPKADNRPNLRVHSGHY